MKERYNILKKIYPKYLIYFIKKGKIVTIGIDKQIIDDNDKKILAKCNKIVIDNLDIIEKVEVENNLYDELLLKEFFINITKIIINRIKK